MYSKIKVNWSVGGTVMSEDVEKEERSDSKTGGERDARETVVKTARQKED